MTKLNEIINLSDFERLYGFRFIGSKPLENVYGGVWKIRSDKDKEFVLKTAWNFEQEDVHHLEAEIAFSRYLSNNVPEIATVEYVPNKEGEIIQPLSEGKGYFYLMKKAKVITRHILTYEEQKELGKWMAIFHKRMIHFNHPGLWGPNYYRAIAPYEEERLRQDFPSHDLDPYINPQGEETVSTFLTTIHGDWHSQNMSWTQPPILLDLGMLARSGRIGELSRTLSHWWFGTESEFVRFYENLVDSYGDLTKEEVKALPLYTMRDFYKSYCEFVFEAKDLKTAEKVKEQIDFARKGLKLY